MSELNSLMMKHRFFFNSEESRNKAEELIKRAFTVEDDYRGYDDDETEQWEYRFFTSGRLKQGEISFILNNVEDCSSYGCNEDDN